MPLTSEELQAIKDAITAGIETALDATLVNPFPQDDPRAAVFHAKGKIAGAVAQKLNKIRTSG